MAIAFDAATAGSQGITSYSHTCNGSLILVGVANLGTLPTVTYGGVSLVQLTTLSATSGYMLTIYYLFAPPQGANNVVISSFGTVGGSGAVSYSGTNAVDAFIAGNGAVDVLSISANLSVVASNCWGLVFAATAVPAGTGTTAVTGYTARLANTSSENYDNNPRRWGWYDSNTTISTGTNSITETVTSGGSPTYANFIAVSIAPGSTTTKNSNFFMFM